ncbi:hypothetical protein [Portibacter marinus]|uniref:hypothetical protein n=1 Tax=Portibacter marinus TaxID=2898660 RepID=UPI001F24B50E|nr:hypothetical protein [Portibacter marinus]
MLTIANGQEWKIFNSEEGEFSVMSPGMMEKKRAFLTTEIGEIELNTLYYHQTDTSGNFLYLINFYELPEETIPPDSTDLAMEFLLNTMDQAVSDIGGDVQYNKEISLGKHPGLLWRSKSEKQIVKSRAYVINNKFYMLQVFSIPRKSLNNDVDRFLESFTLRPS